MNAANVSIRLPVQMTEDWLKCVARNKLNGLGGLKQQTANAIINAPAGFIQKYVVAVDKTTGQINFLKLGSGF